MTGKIVVIGSGYVGATTAYTLFLQQIATEIVVIDLNQAKARGDVLDIDHGVPLVGHTRIKSGDYPDCADAEIIVITAGVAQKPGESRLDLLQRNHSIMNHIIDQIEAYNQEAILLMVTNPVDIMTWIACQRSSRPHNRIIGSGTLLDSSRFRLYIAQELGVDPSSVQASILGEHGDSQVPVWSTAQISGMPVTFDAATRQSVAEKTRTAAQEIIVGKGATYYAVSVAIARICKAILRDEQAVLEVSVPLSGQYGLDQVCLGVPCVVGKDGIREVLTFSLSDEESSALKASAAKLKENIQLLNFSEGTTGEA
jgi:L-lactate dehydrogenase